MYACQHGSVEGVKLFLSHGAKLDVKVAYIAFVL